MASEIRDDILSWFNNEFLNELEQAKMGSWWFDDEFMGWCSIEEELKAKAENFERYLYKGDEDSKLRAMNLI